MYQKILVATDGSENARRAIAHAASLAREFRGTITCVYASYVPPIYTPDIGPELMSAIAEEGERILSMSKDVAADQDVPVSTKLLTQGRPAQAICKEAKDGSYDLVVLGVRGTGKVGYNRMGTVSSEVARYAPCSVLIVR
jgi:nucleotide-binding universal stress UspA family protein